MLILEAYLDEILKKSSNAATTNELVFYRYVRPVTQTGNNIVNEATTTIEIVKIDESTRDATNPDRLADASFRLLKYNGSSYVAYDDRCGAEDGIRLGESGPEQGRLTFENLPEGEYKIVETNTPNGYVKAIDNDIYFGIQGGIVTRYDGPVSSDGRNPIPAKMTVEGVERDNVVAAISFAPDTATFTVGNTPGAALPSAGGTGADHIYPPGFLITCLACAGFVMRKYWRAS